MVQYEVTTKVCVCVRGYKNKSKNFPLDYFCLWYFQTVKVILNKANTELIQYFEWENVIKYIFKNNLGCVDIKTR